MIDSLKVVAGTLQRLGRAVAAPLKANDELASFTLAIPEAHTTTVEGDTGWGSRPPATLVCPQCSSDIYQHRPREPIDCPRCTGKFPYETFGELELLHLDCPCCGAHMRHGQRHPDVFDVPEWATCDTCHYHWEFKHFY